MNFTTYPGGWVGGWLGGWVGGWGVLLDIKAISAQLSWSWG